jgi:hypothetical protein
MTYGHTPITRFSRELTVSTLLQGGLWTLAVIAFLLSIAPGGSPLLGNLVLLLIVIAWVILSYRSARGSRITADSPNLIAAGRFREAEERIGEVIGTFGLFRNVKLVGLHHLALLRHAEKRFHDAAAVCRLILKQRLGGVRGLAKPTQLILADSALEMGDLRAAYDAISALYRERLTLGEALTLLSIQSDYLAHIGAWDELVESMEKKVALAELMPPSAAARTQAMLALAARRTGRAFLRRRVELLTDVQELTAQRPMLMELWQVASPAGSDESAHTEVRHDEVGTDGGRAE